MILQEKKLKKKGKNPCPPVGYPKRKNSNSCKKNHLVCQGKGGGREKPLRYPSQKPRDKTNHAHWEGWDRQRKSSPTSKS